jgi:outer membrane lipoprotein-sorting protein
MKSKIAVLFVCVSLLAGGAAYASQANQVLANVDAAVNGQKDQDFSCRLVLIDKSGKESTRETVSLQKGTDKRLIKFLSPSDQKGIGLLSLPDDVMYLYMPAFKKTRRIASHVKNGKFAGTDFTYEDLEAKKYVEKWQPTIIKEDGSSVTLELKPLPNVQTDYSKMVMQVQLSNNYPVKTEMYDKSGKLFKALTRSNIEKIGDYYISKEMMMEDLISGHKSKMIFDNIKFDSGLSDEKFTERYLEKQ